jgi:Mg-chelatase subunit ChlD
VSDPADVVFLLDRSGSVGKSAFQTELQFIAEFAKHYVIGPRNVQIGVVTFSGSPTKVFDLKSIHDINELEKKLMNIKYIFNGTHTSTALKFVRENSFSTAAGDRPNVPNFLIVITDGKSRPAKFNPKIEAAILHATNIEVSFLLPMLPVYLYCLACLRSVSYSQCCLFTCIVHSGLPIRIYFIMFIYYTYRIESHVVVDAG